MSMILFAALVSVCNISQSAFTKVASSKGKISGSMSFNTIKVGASLVFFVLLSLYNMKFHIPTMAYAAVYGFALFFSTYFGYLALMNGSMALTSLLVSYSVIIPCAFGIFFLNEPVGYIKILGIILLLVSMYLLKNQADKVKMGKRWLLYVLITFLCNGLCSVIQKLHQTVYPAEFCLEFMIYSLFVSFIFFLVITICKKEKKAVGAIKYAIAAGVLMGLGNYLTLMLSSRVDATVLFPVISVSSMIFNVIVSKVYFKDKFSLIQLIGIVLGVISVLLIK